LLNSRFLDLHEEGNELVCCLGRCFEEHFGLGLRRQETRRKVRLHLKSVGQIAASPTDTPLKLVVESDSSQLIAAVIERIDHDLAAIAERPLTSHEVQDALHITARERIRWTKDKRLRTSGTFTAQRQQIVTMNTYSVNDIRKLYLQPATIEAWRAADRVVADGLSHREPA
jgi:hypothetical protein